MSDKEKAILEAKSILDEALEACARLNSIDDEVLSEVARMRIKWPITLLGTSGYTSRGKKADDYAESIGLGSGISLEVGNTSNDLKRIILNYIDWVYKLKEQETIEKPEIEAPQEWIENGLEEEFHEEVERYWEEALSASKLPPLSDATVAEWTEMITESILYDAYIMGQEEPILIDGEEQLFTVWGLPEEIQRQTLKNYRKLIARRIKRAEKRAEEVGLPSIFIERLDTLEEMRELWREYLVKKSRSRADLLDLQESAAREVVSDILRRIVKVSPG